MQLSPALASQIALHEHLKFRLREEFPDVDDDTLVDTLEGLTDLPEVLAAIIRSREEDETLLDALKARIEQMKARLQRFQERAERKRLIVTEVMERACLKRLSFPDFTASLRTLPPAIEVENEQQIPETFWRPQPPKLDRTALGEALRMGTLISGARLGEPRTSLTIRTR